MIQPTIEELRSEASLWWPAKLQEQNAQASIIPRLLETQDDFLRLLLLAKGSPFKLFDLIEAAEFPANLFLKHLVVLADYGGERIQRLGRSFADIFPDENGRFFFDFVWSGESHRYNFQKMPLKTLNNRKLSIDGERLLVHRVLDDLLRDMTAILLFASTSSHAHLAGLDVCEIGQLLGNEDALTRYVQQKYIVVSRITGGATANNLGQLAQTEIIQFLETRLNNSFTIQRNGSIILTGYEKIGGMPFDVVVTKNGRKVGIEVSFQVTTNSTIERKAGQAADRQKLMHDDGYLIAYVIDGAGNFQRTSALQTIINHSNCTVAYTDSQFSVLADWIEEVL